MDGHALTAFAIRKNGVDSGWRLCSALALAIAFVATSRASLADEPTPPANTPKEAPISPAKVAARAEFDRGVELFRQGNWDAALVAFRRSIDLFPTRAALTNAALCLRNLSQIDEALTTLEMIPERFGPLSEEDRNAYDATVAELLQRVGSVELPDLPPGTLIQVDGRDRGVSPLAAPLRLTQGPHRLTVVKAGTPPVERVLDVVGGTRIILHLQPAPDATGRLEASTVADSSATSAGPSRWSLAAEVGGVLTSLGGEVISCGDCSVGLGWGGRALGRLGYRLDDAWMLSVQAGYLRLAQTVDDRATNVITAFGQDPGVASDTLTLSGALIGVGAEYQLSRPFDASVRAGVGALLGGLHDERSGSFTSASPGFENTKYSVNVSQRPPAHYAYVSLAFQIDFLRAGEFRLAAGLEVTGLIALSQPSWDESDHFLVEGSLQSTFASQTLSSRFVPLFCPFVGARYTF